MSRDRHKAETLAKAEKQGARFRRRGATFTILEGPYVTEEVDDDGNPTGVKSGLLCVGVRATREGAELPTNNPYYFSNPPLKTKSGREDHQAVLRDIVADAVLGGE